MGQTAFANAMGVAHKGSGGITIAFPDVCLTPGVVAGAPGPLPYPNIAKTATAKQQAKATSSPGIPAPGTVGPAKVTGGVMSNKIKGKCEYMMYSFDVKIEGKNVCRLGAAPFYNPNTEAAQLRNMLNDLTQQMLRLPGGKPQQWQEMLEKYAVAVSALYVTITD